HSDAQDSPTYNTVAWNGTPQTCRSCHGEADLKNDVKMSGMHNSHVGTDVYSFACGECHGATVADNTNSPITNKVYHVDGVKNVVFTTVGAKDQSAGSYGSGTCSTTYCHSDGKDSYTATDSPDWSSDSATCTTCHKNNGASTTLSDAHLTHINTTTQSYTCDNCHSETVDNNTTTTLTSFPNVHVDGIQNVVFSATGFATDNHNFLANGASYNDGTETCDNVYCHSTVQAQLGVDPPTYKTPQWGSAALDCDAAACHRGRKNGIAMNSGSHPKHVSFEEFECWYCHDSGGPANVANHVDGKIQIVMNSTVGGIYNQGPADTPRADTATAQACTATTRYSPTGTMTTTNLTAVVVMMPTGPCRAGTPRTITQ
ncbi:hypothetical protein LCGC14_2931040, partial [marine sediment metagenome]